MSALQVASSAEHHHLAPAEADAVSQHHGFSFLKTHLKPNSACDALSDTESMMGTSPISPLQEHYQASYVSAQTIDTQRKDHEDPAGYTSLSYKTLVGVSEILGHSLDDRTSIATQQDPMLQQRLQLHSTTPLRSPAQRPLFTVAPLDVL